MGHDENLITFLKKSTEKINFNDIFDIHSLLRVLPLLILPHFLVIFGLILCSKNLKIPITKNGFDEKFFLAWIHLYYSKVFPKSEVPTLFNFVRVKMVPQSHVCHHKGPISYAIKQIVLASMYQDLLCTLPGLVSNNDFKRVFGRPIWVWRVNKSRVGVLSHLSDTGTAGTSCVAH